MHQMNVMIIVTNKIKFSNDIISYFKEMNLQNYSHLTFIPIGLDEGSEEQILESIYERINQIKFLNIITIFSDLGLPNQFSKRIKVNIPNVNVLYSNGSLIEKGFLTYMLLNTGAPLDTIEKMIKD